MKIFRQILAKIRNNELVKNSAFLISSNSLAQIITLLLYPLIARLYTPDEFGQLAVILSIHSLIVTVASGRYELAITLPRSETQASDLFVIGLRISLVVSLLVAPVVYLVRIAGIHFDTGYAITVWFYLLGIVVFLTAYQLLVHNWCIRYKLFSVIAVSTLVVSISNALFKMVLGFLKTPDGLLYSFFAAQFITALYLFVRSNQEKNRPPLLYGSSAIHGTAKTYIDFPKYNMATALINNFSGNLPIYVFSIYFTENLTGQFSIAFALLFKPVITYNNSIYQVIMQKMVALKHANQPVWPFVKHYMLRTLYLSVLPGTALVFLMPRIIQLYLGENWTDAGRFCQLMLPYAILTLLAGSLTFIPNIFNRQFKSLVINVIYLILRVVALAAGVVAGNVYLAVGLFALSGIVIFTYQICWFRKLVLESDRSPDQPEPSSTIYPHGAPENFA